MKAILSLPLHLLKFLAWVLVIAVPTLGVWVASSLAAYLNGPIWLACAAGLLLFPVFPIAWDLWASDVWEKKQERRKADGKEPRERHLKFADRLILRTFFLNIGFIAALLATYPQVGFTALATRGDWILDDVQSPRAQLVRPVIFAAAEKLEWVYEWSRENPYEQYQDEEPLPTPKPNEFAGAQPAPTPTPVETPTSAEPTPTPGPNPPVAVTDGGTVAPKPPDPSRPRQPGKPPAWPLPPTLHPAVAEIPADVETSYESVARYIASKEADPFMRIKALNDYIADRVVYDVPALSAAVRPAQDAKTVFETRKAVCAGYSRLLKAMADVTGDEVVYVVGVSRDRDGSVAGGGHAWNAAKIEDEWYLIDTTWNAGYVEGNRFVKEYETSYLFTPPDIFGASHFPDDEAWQLLAEPISRGDFIRLPMLKPGFYSEGLVLVTPKRSQVDAEDGTAIVQLQNPRRAKVLASIESSASGEKRCNVVGARDVKVMCDVPAGETARLQLFAGDQSLRTFPLVGSFEIVGR